MDERSDFWVNLCSNVVHPVGWCATKGKPLIPPKCMYYIRTKIFQFNSVASIILVFLAIQSKHRDWKEFLVKRLTGARTLPTNFRLKIFESLKSKFR